MVCLRKKLWVLESSSTPSLVVDVFCFHLCSYNELPSQELKINGVTQSPEQ